MEIASRASHLIIYVFSAVVTWAFCQSLFLTTSPSLLLLELELEWQFTNKLAEANRRFAVLAILCLPAQRHWSHSRRSKLWFYYLSMVGLSLSFDDLHLGTPEIELFTFFTYKISCLLVSFPFLTRLGAATCLKIWSPTTTNYELFLRRYECWIYCFSTEFHYCSTCVTRTLSCWMSELTHFDFDYSLSLTIPC